MNTGIKTCTKCGAKNFMEFKTCFNCGGTDFVVSKSVVPPTTDSVNKKAPVGLQHISQPLPPERPAEEEEQSGARRVPSDRLERTERVRRTEEPEIRVVAKGGGERRTIFDTRTPAPSRPLTPEEKEERVKRVVKRPVSPPEEFQPTPSKLNMQAQQERLKREAEEREAARLAAERRDEALDQIASRLSSLETKLVSPPSPPQEEIRHPAEDLRQTVEENIRQLDTAIGELKANSREVLDEVVAAQREQIVRLEQERSEFESRLLEEREKNGRNSEMVSYLEDERSRLTSQLDAERTRFDLLLRDREHVKALSQLPQIEVPGDYIVFTGENASPDYLEYARRQFLKIYPKIERGEGGEDVIYYIPGEFKNPPVLVLNPDVAKDYKRNIKINLVDTVPAPAVIEGKNELARLEEGGLPQPPATPPLAVPSEVTAAELQPEKSAAPQASIGEVAAMETLSEMLKRMETETPQAAVPSHAEKESAAGFGPLFEEKSAEETPRPEPVFGSVLNSAAIQSGAIQDIAVAQSRQRQVKKRLTLVCVLLGLLAAASLAALALPYLAEAKGYEALLSILHYFSKKYENGYLLYTAVASGKWAALAPHMGLFALLAAIATLSAAVSCFMGCGQLGGRKAARVALFALALLADVFLLVSVPMVFGAELGKDTGYGLWIKLAVDAALIVCALLFLREPGEEQEEVPETAAVGEPVDSIRLDESLLRVRDEITKE